jgi:modulator of FtsH protease
MRDDPVVISARKQKLFASSSSSALATNKVLKNTYFLLSLTLLFSAVVAYWSMSLNFRPGLLMFLIGAYGLMFLTYRLKNSPWGLVTTFAFTGFMGFTLGPILSYYLQLPNGGQLIGNALGLTGVTFLGLSGYALVSRKDFSFLSGFLFAGFIVLVGAMLLGFFTNIAGLQLAISAGFVLFSSAVILYQTSAIIHGGETNYIVATITLYLSIYNLFVSLLNILGYARN